MGSGEKKMPHAQVRAHSQSHIVIYSQPLTPGHACSLFHKHSVCKEEWNGITCRKVDRTAGHHVKVSQT